MQQHEILTNLKEFLPLNEGYRRLHLPVNARAKNMFSRDVKRLCFRCQTFKFLRAYVTSKDFRRLL